MSVDAKEKEPISSPLESEIDNAIDALVDEGKPAEEPKEEKAETKQDISDEGDDEIPSDIQDDDGGELEVDQVDGDVLDKNEPEEKKADKPSVPDELIERAVKAGFSLKEARDLGEFNQNLLESQIQRMERPSKEEVNEDKPVDDPFAGLPELKPEDYDEDYIKVVETLKEAVISQREEISNLKNSAKGNDQSFVVQKTQELGLKLPAEKQAALQDTFDALKAGYESRDRQVDDALIFEQASKAVIAQEIEESSNVAKAKKAQKRQKIARPGGQGQKKQSDDPLGDIASEIDDKYFKK